MTTRVYGAVDGVEVIFTPSADGKTWTCQIPRGTEGEYVVELWAENDLGNTSYFATILFTVRGVDVTITWLKLSAQARMREFAITSKILPPTVTAKMLSDKRPSGKST